MKLIYKLLSAVIIAVVLQSCGGVSLTPASYDWPIETVLEVDNKGFVSDKRYSFSVNVKQLFVLEFKDSTAAPGSEVRIIRNEPGFYFITSADFKNVYVLQAAEGALLLNNTIMVKESGLTSPVFNQRKPWIELIDGGDKFYLDKNGLKGDSNE